MTPLEWIQPIPLQGRTVRLEPLSSNHVDALWKIANHSSIWEWMPIRVKTRAHMAAMIDNALTWPIRKWGQAFVQIATDDTVVGGTAYLNAEPQHRRVEIGWTWITPSYQRTAINTEAKLLLMRHAFTKLKVNRLEFKTDSQNLRSRAAITRIGGIEEGTLRNHIVRPDGSMRHSTYFSVVAQEWPEVESRLLEMLSARRDVLPVARLSD